MTVGNRSGSWTNAFLKPN